MESFLLYIYICGATNSNAILLGSTRCMSACKTFKRYNVWNHFEMNINIPLKLCVQVSKPLYISIQCEKLQAYSSKAVRSLFRKLYLAAPHKVNIFLSNFVAIAI